MTIRSIPNSSYIRTNQIQFNIIVTNNPGVIKTYDVNFIYSYYDQILHGTNTENNMDFIMGTSIIKMIFYKAF